MLKITVVSSANIIIRYFVVVGKSRIVSEIYYMKMEGKRLEGEEGGKVISKNKRKGWILVALYNEVKEKRLNRR